MSVCGGGPAFARATAGPPKLFERRLEGPAASAVKMSACGHAELRIWKSEARHRRQFAVGVGPRRQ
jgi:hypothetical protein